MKVGISNQVSQKLCTRAASLMLVFCTFDSLAVANAGCRLEIVNASNVPITCTYVETNSNETTIKLGGTYFFRTPRERIFSAKCGTKGECTQQSEDTTIIHPFQIGSESSLASRVVCEGGHFETNIRAYDIDYACRSHLRASTEALAPD